MKFDALSRMHSALDDGVRKLVEFRVGDVRCGTDIMRVREIVNVQPTVPVPAAPPFIVGAADHRESMVPVIDLCLRLGLSPGRKRRPKWVIVVADGTDVALLVDMVVGVTAVSASNARTRHPLMDGSDERWVRAVFSVGKELLFELDLESVTRLDPRRERDLPAQGDAP